MSSDGDIIAVENSMHDNLTEASTVHFSDKNFTYITDSTSNSGAFQSGQIQFDLSTLASQSQWINLSEAVIEFPVKITSTLTSAVATTAAINTAIIKNGWHQWIDSCQVVINGQTVQSSQTYENIASQFRILSSWSQDTLKKWGSSCGFALDDCTNSETSTSYATINGLNNATASTVMNSVRGFDATNQQNIIFNKGTQARMTMTNNDISANSLQGAILGNASMRQSATSNVASAGSKSAVNDALYSGFFMATVRLKDICDINEFPLVKNLKGYVYLTFNSASLTVSTGASNLVSNGSVAVQILSGRTCPILLNTTVSGISTANTSYVINATVDGTSTGAVGNSGPLLTSARLLVPYYVSNPKTDLALSKSNKFFTTLEKIVNPIVATAGSSVNYTITVGVPNPRKLLLLPMWQGLGGATYLTNPEVSPFDTVPATSGPFAQLSNLQVYLANKPIYQYPLQYTYEQWLNENSQLGLNGALVNESTSGLLTQQLFQQNHSFYAVDLSRRAESANGSSQSVQVSFTNPSPTYGMKVIAIVWYEKQWVIETTTCTLSNV